MGLNYLWDTNTVIYYLQNQFPPKCRTLYGRYSEGNTPDDISHYRDRITMLETATPDDIKVLKNFIEDAYIIELERSVKDLTVDVRKRYNLKLPDAIIASSALANGLILITRNKKDFERIGKLSVVNPFDA
jgi:predicted nucleic acid-binding protein